MITIEPKDEIRRFLIEDLKGGNPHMTSYFFAKTNSQLLLITTNLFQSSYNPRSYRIKYSATHISAPFKSQLDANAVVERLLLDPFEINNHTFAFSEEVKKGIKGLRNDEHFIPVAALKQAAKKKVNKIFRNKAQERFVFYFNFEGRILNVIFLTRQDWHATILTAYFPTQSYLAYEFGLTTPIRFDAWKNGCPKLKFS